MKQKLINGFSLVHFNHLLMCTPNDGVLFVEAVTFCISFFRTSLNTFTISVQYNHKVCCEYRSHRKQTSPHFFAPDNVSFSYRTEQRKRRPHRYNTQNKSACFNFSFFLSSIFIVFTSQKIVFETQLISVCHFFVCLFVCPLIN